LPAAAVEEKSVLSEPGKLHISVARNEESFSFLYAEHLDILRRMGTVTFFNPEQDRAIPQETDLLYLPGGYPENRLEELAGARLARESIRSYIEAGGRTLAECGGMIYLSQFVLSDGDTDGGSAGNCVGNIGNEMVGVLPFSITNERKRRKLTLGYRRFDYNGWRLKGHEFHYTQFAVPETDGKEGGACSLPPSIAQVYNAKGGKVTTPVFRYKNLIASYTHLYWGEVDVMALFGEL
jgi:cobyrinic acid a,c-diamide synthase